MGNKNIAIIGTVGIPSKYGGFETLVEYLTTHLKGEYNFTVFCSGKSYDTKLKEYNGANLSYINLKANGIQSIPYDILAIFKSLKFADTLLVLGVSGCVILPIVKLFSNKKILINIDGLEWKRNKWGKFSKWFLKLSEKVAVNYADEVITDNKVLTDYVKSEYGVGSHLIAYGSDQATNEVLDEDIIKKYSFLKSKYSFKVCRIEPENNIHVVLEAFSKSVINNFVLVGNWGNSNYGMELKKKYSFFENIFLLDPIYNQKILNQIRSNCFVYIHGHSAGGTNPSLVEAMHLKLPVIAFGAEYNKETTCYEALYFNNKLELIGLLDNLDSKELSKVGESMKKIANSEYTWKKISNKYAELF